MSSNSCSPGGASVVGCTSAGRERDEIAEEKLPARLEHQMDLVPVLDERILLRHRAWCNPSRR